jgi:hypothetical protein
MAEWLWGTIGLSKTTHATRAKITPQIWPITKGVVMGLVWLAVSLRFLWSGGYPIVPFMFENPDMMDTIGSFPLFEIWPGLEEQRWFGMTAFGMAIFKLVIAAVAGFFALVSAWEAYKGGRIVSEAIDGDVRGWNK